MATKSLSRSESARYLAAQTAEIEALRAQLAESQAQLRESETARQALEAQGDVRQAGVSRIRESYLKRLNQQTKSTKTLSDTVTTILGAVREISISYKEMLQAIHSVSAVCRALDDSFQLQVSTQQAMAGQATGAEEASVNEVLKAQALKADLSQLEAIRDFMARGVETIDEVSARLSLLSMNGRIEAAHAGAVGRGFAVVAQEMLKLQTESQKVITSQKAQLAEFLPLMATMQEKSDAVERQAREQQVAIRDVASGGRVLEDQTRTNQEHISGLTSAVEELAASIEQGERTTKVVDEQAAKVEGIFKEEVYISQKINDLDFFLFQVGKKAQSVAEASHNLINEYQRISVLNGVNYVWQGEAWLVTDRNKLPSALADRAAAWGDRVLVCVGQTDNNKRFPSPWDEAEGILEVRPLADLEDPRSPLQDLKVFLTRIGLTIDELRHPSRIRNPLDHANMAVTEQFTGDYARTMENEIRRGSLVCTFAFGGAFPNADVLVCHFLSTLARHHSDAEKFGMVGESLVMSFQGLVESGRYWKGTGLRSAGRP